VTDRLRPLWDFDDLDASERRLREQLAEEPSDAGRAEVLTQLARVEGLRGRFEEGERLIAEAEALAGDSSIAKARIDIERGRLLRSSGDSSGAFPLFKSGFELALGADEHFVAADAAHMAALAAPDRAGYDTWTQRGIELAESYDEASYWLGPLLNNLGWDRYDAGELDGALEAFQAALAARERDPDNPTAIAIAHYAVARALQALDRPEEAVAELERAAARWAESGDSPDGWYHEALAEGYAALGREPEAREHATLAIPLLLEADPSFEADEERVARLRGLAST
jgi:tetratricopeptide (TPR) repeat protein